MIDDCRLLLIIHQSSFINHHSSIVNQQSSIMKNRLTNIAFLIWLIAVLILSVVPNSETLTQGPFSFDKHGYFQHLMAYAVGMWIGFYSNFLESKWNIFLLVLLWGIILEIIQFWLPYRSFNVFDLFSNIFATIVTFLILERL